MGSAFQTRILVSPSLSAPISYAGGLTMYGGDFGVFAPCSPALLPNPIGVGSADGNYRDNSLPALPSEKLETIDPSTGSQLSVTASINIDSIGLFELPDLLSPDPLRESFMESFFPSTLRRHSVELLSPTQSSKLHNRSRPMPEPAIPQLTAPTGPSLRRIPSPLTTERSRRRRQKISDRTRILEKLMPWERRLDTGTMLEEAHKYVKFLEAQVTALESMPAVSGLSPLPMPPGHAAGLERLTRQQLLQVMVNSPLVQDMLYKKGFCVVSAEQTAALRRAMERRLQPLLFLGPLTGDC